MSKVFLCILRQHFPHARTFPIRAKSIQHISKKIIFLRVHFCVKLLRSFQLTQPFLRAIRFQFSPIPIHPLMTLIMCVNGKESRKTLNSFLFDNKIWAHKKTDKRRTEAYFAFLISWHKRHHVWCDWVICCGTCNAAWRFNNHVLPSTGFIVMQLGLCWWIWIARLIERERFRQVWNVPGPRSLHRVDARVSTWSVCRWFPTVAN